jgi:hypothetical protein
VKYQKENLFFCLFYNYNLAGNEIEEPESALPYSLALGKN